MLKLLFSTVAAALLPLAATADPDYNEAARNFERLFSWSLPFENEDDDRKLEDAYSSDASSDRCTLIHTTTRLVGEREWSVEVITIDLSTVEMDSIGKHGLGWTDPPDSWSVFLRPRDHRGYPVSRTVFSEKFLAAPENSTCTGVPCTLSEFTNNPYVFPRRVREDGMAEGLATATALVEQCQ